MKRIKIEIKWAIIFSLMSLVWYFAEKLLGFHDSRLQQQQQYSFGRGGGSTVQYYGLHDNRCFRRNHYRVGILGGIIIIYKNKKGNL
jgi:hypothetical protein